jgi:hypothetical protein
MSTNAYELARQHANNEINEINEQIEKLTQRKGLIEKLLGVFEELDPQSSSADHPASEAQAPEVAGTELPEFHSAPEAQY